MGGLGMKIGAAVILFFLVTVTTVFAEIKELDVSGQYGRWTRDGKKRVKIDHVICVDTFKVFQTVAFGYGEGTGAAVSNIQLMEDRDGKLVPVRCLEKEK